MSVNIYNGTSLTKIAGKGGGSTAKDITYDNTTSGLSATNVQTAIDAVSDEITHIVGDAWASGTEYAVGDCTIYNNTVYECILAHTASESILPTDTTYWSVTSLSEINNNLSNLIKSKAFSGTPSASGALQIDIDGTFVTGVVNNAGYIVLKRSDKYISIYNPTNSGLSPISSAVSGTIYYI